ncbi:MAG: hypothetical protein Q4A34_02430 [Candidatus Saccharibacteria bacterium]|nr:hypothetical protein [Candidatus Saccharibacteria bacterium]
MENDEWYCINDNPEYPERGLALTPAGKSMPEVVQSYEDFYAIVRDEDTGVIIDP